MVELPGLGGKVGSGGSCGRAGTAKPLAPSRWVTRVVALGVWFPWPGWVEASFPPPACCENALFAIAEGLERGGRAAPRRGSHLCRLLLLPCPRLGVSSTVAIRQTAGTCLTHLPSQEPSPLRGAGCLHAGAEGSESAEGRSEAFPGFGSWLVSRRPRAAGREQAAESACQAALPTSGPGPAVAGPNQTGKSLQPLYFSGIRNKNLF